VPKKNKKSRPQDARNSAIDALWLGDCCPAPKKKKNGRRRGGCAKAGACSREGFFRQHQRNIAGGKERENKTAAFKGRPFRALYGGRKL